MDYLVSSDTTINDIKLSGSDTLTITDGGTVNNTTLGAGCSMFVSSGGSANITSVTDATYTVSSGGTATRTLLNGTEALGGAMHVEDGGYAEVVFVNAYSNLYVYAGGTAKTVVWTPCIGHVSVEDGADVELYSSYSGVYYGTGDELFSSAASMAYKTVSTSEEMYVFSGGVISRTVLDSFATVRISGGTAEDTTIKAGTLVIAGGVANNTVNSAGEINVSSGGILNSATLLENGIIRIFEGGVAINTIVSSAAFNVYPGGTASGFTISEGGGLYTGTGATLTGRMILSDDAYVSLEQDTTIDFNISALTPGAAVRINNFQLVYGWKDANYTVTISGTQANGTYSLAIGFPSAYKRTISVVNTEGTTLTTLSVGETRIIGGAECTLAIEDDTLIFRKGKEEEVPDRPPVVDNGSNDWLYVKKTKTLNEDLANSTPTVLSSETRDVCLDPADQIHYEENENVFLNYVGADDEFDYLKVRLEKGALLSFSLVSTDAAKFVIYSLAPGKVTKGVQTYTQTALQTTALKKSRETGIYYTANTKGILLEKGDYYIAVQSTAKKNGNAYYSVAVDQSASKFYVLGDNSDDWTDMKTAGDTSELLGTVGTISSASAAGILAEWVGFGDTIDYKSFTLDSDAVISLSLNATDKTKFTIWKLNSKTSKKGVTTYSLTSVQTTTLSKPNDAAWYSATTKSILLDKGTYYFSMESTNAKKGGSADYLVTLNSTGSFFFVHAQENFDDNWLYDKKTKVLNPDLDHFCMTEIVSTNTKTILLDGDEDISLQVRGVEYSNFAGYGDAADYALISVDDDVKLSFTVTSTGKGKFTVWRIDEKTDKKGKVTYSVKSLQATTLTMPKNSAVYTCTTKSLELAAGQYYVSFQSTDAAKGGSAYYNVELNLAGCSGLPAGEEESVAEAMLYPGPDAVAEQSALAGETGYDNALASAVSALGDVQTDAFLKESALLA